MKGKQRQGHRVEPDNRGVTMLTCDLHVIYM